MARTRLLACALALALLGAACGGSGGSTKSQGSNRSAGSSATSSGATTPGKKRLIMPDMKGKTEDEARSILSDRGVDDAEIVVDQKESLEKPGTIVDQVPSAGEDISGSVTLVAAKEVGPVPDFAGKKIADVKKWAAARNIKVRQAEILDDTKSEGEVIGTTPAIR